MPKLIKAKPATRTKSATRTPTKTPQRIVTRSIALFNRYGVQSVAIERICTDLKISPGNLTYHFPRKDDLIRASVEVLKEHLHQALERPTAVKGPQEGAEYLIRIFRTFWDFRFYFNALAFLLTDDPALRKEYYVLRDWLIDTMASDMEFLAERGHMTAPLLPNTFRLLSENIYGLLLNWLRTQQIEHPSAPTPSNAALRDVALHLWSLSQHWMNAPYAHALLKVYLTMLADPKAESGAAAKTASASTKTSRSSR